MFRCRKHKSTNQTGDQNGMLNQLGDSGSMIGEAGEIVDGGSSYDHCAECRTRLFTSILTIKCHYCKPGFMRPIMVDKLADEDDNGEDQERLSKSSLVCFSCGNELNPVPFIIQACFEVQEWFDYWLFDFVTTDRMTSLEQMQKYYDQLVNLVSQQNIRMVRMAVQLALGYHAKGNLVRAIEYSHLAIRTFLEYRFDGPDSVPEMFVNLCKQLNRIIPVHRGISNFQHRFASYFDDAEKLKKFSNELGIKIEDVYGDVDDGKSDNEDNK